MALSGDLRPFWDPLGLPSAELLRHFSPTVWLQVPALLGNKPHPIVNRYGNVPVSSTQGPWTSPEYLFQAASLMFSDYGEI